MGPQGRESISRIWSATRAAYTSWGKVAASILAGIGLVADERFG